MKRDRRTWRDLRTGDLEEITKRTARTFKTADREVVVEKGKWEASAGRVKVTVIED